ncbi:hypothetical protein D3C84_1153490 [compost metagenome]
MIPEMISTKIAPTNTYTGIANTEADSPTPRKFIIVRNNIIVMAMSTRWSWSEGNADVMASVPADELTATVRI